TNAVLGFAGSTRFLSNFWFASVEFEGLVYPTTEHAYQAAKTLSSTQRYSIRSLPKPWEAKSAGRNIALRDDWNDVRTEVMLELAHKKFMHPQLRTALLGLGSRPIYEVTTRWNDTTWGVVERHDHFHGANRLGRIL
ncbi:NADAR family protein, partial [Haemophilus influenzae]